MKVQQTEACVVLNYAGSYISEPTYTHVLHTGIGTYTHMI